MTIETKELVISEELKRKVEMICKFAYVEYSFINGSIISLKNTNISYVKPHVLKVKDFVLPLDNYYYLRIHNVKYKYFLQTMFNIIFVFKNNLKISMRCNTIYLCSFI